MNQWKTELALNFVQRKSGNSGTGLLLVAAEVCGWAGFSLSRHCAPDQSFFYSLYTAEIGTVKGIVMSFPLILTSAISYPFEKLQR